MAGQLWWIGIEEIVVDGSFAEVKVHPNDIDGYFCCELKRLASGELERELNRLDPQLGLDADSGVMTSVSRLPEAPAPHVAYLLRGAVSA